MNAVLSKYALAGGLFLLIFASGFWLQRAGRPYSMLPVTLHKLAALGALATLIVTFVRARPEGAPAQAAAVLAGACFVALIATGALLSLPKPPPAAAAWAHKLLPYLALLSSSGGLYLLLPRG